MAGDACKPHYAQSKSHLMRASGSASACDINFCFVCMSVLYMFDLVVSFVRVSA